MTAAEWPDDDKISLYVIGTLLLRKRMVVALWTFVGGVVAVSQVLFKPPMYLASASFQPQDSDPTRSGLANIAGQLGVSFSSASQSQSPEFYAGLLTSRELLGPIVRDTLVPLEMQDQRIAFVDLFEIEGETAGQREEEGVMFLREIVETSVDNFSGVVGLSVETQWPSVSLSIVTALINGVNDFNQRTRQSRAAAERSFVEGRLDFFRTELRSAEGSLVRFIRGNRMVTGSPELTFEQDRLQRDVAMLQQVFTTLTQSYEEARIREVRDTPVITVVESPTLPTMPGPRGRLRFGIMGLVLGGFVGSLVIFVSAMLAAHQETGSKEVKEFVEALNDVKNDVLGPIRWLRERVGR